MHQISLHIPNPWHFPSGHLSLQSMQKTAATPLRSFFLPKEGHHTLSCWIRARMCSSACRRIASATNGRTCARTSSALGMFAAAWARASMACSRASRGSCAPLNPSPPAHRRQGARSPLSDSLSPQTRAKGTSSVIGAGWREQVVTQACRRPQAEGCPLSVNGTLA